MYQDIKSLTLCTICLVQAAHKNHKMQRTLHDQFSQNTLHLLYYVCTKLANSFSRDFKSVLCHNNYWIVGMIQYSPLITLRTRGIFCVVPSMIVMLATQNCSVGHVPSISYCLPRMALPRLLLIPMFLALLYTYDVIHCIHVY